MLLLASILCLTLWPRFAGAQSVQHTKNSADLDLRSPLKVNPASNALELQIPLGQGAYPQRSGASMPLTLDYSSRIWRMAYGGTTYNGPNQPQATLVIPKLSEYSRLGWTFSLGEPFIDGSANVEYYDAWGNPVSQCVVNGEQASSCCFIDRIRIHLPDGSTHEFRSTDKPFCLDEFGQTDALPDILYSVDGSRMKYKRSTNTLYFPDGSYWVLANGSTPAQYFDRNGNRLLSNGTDSLGRVFTDPLAGTGTDYTYTVPGAGGSPLTYTLRWRNLDQVLTVPQALPNFSDYCTGSGCTGPYLFTSDTANFPPIQVVGGPSKINPQVLHQIVLPHDAADTTPPTYTFTYNVYGEIDKVVYPTGGYERFSYGLVETQQTGTHVYAESNRGVLERWVSAKGDGTDEAHWQYAWNDTQGQLRRGEISPDGTRTERLNIYTPASTSPWSYGDARTGRPAEERVYNASGQMLRRKLTEWEKQGSDYCVTGAFNACMATRNPHVLKEVEIILDTGGQALWTMTAYEYDADLNATAVKRYGYKLLDQATAQVGAISAFLPDAPLRTDETTYLVNDPAIDTNTRAAYRARNLLSLPTSTRIKDGAGTIVAKSAVSYDETAYPLLTYASVPNWTNPQTGVRGNVTTASAWLNTTDTWVSKHTQYDQCGSPRKIWDAEDNLSQVTYSATYKYAYPTQSTSADPDGTAGPLSSLATSTAYDLTTGRVTSQTDANGRTTTTEYAVTDTLGNPNPLQRLTKVNRPDGSWTAYGYSDQPDNLYVFTRTALDNSRYMEARSYFDGLGRDWRSVLVEGATSIYADTQYDSMGRVLKVSNPYRPGDTVRWTTTAYDALGRVKQVTTPDNAKVTTSYSGVQTTVTDQSNKARSSIKDALGRLTQVIEDPDGLGYETGYTYDVLGNLRIVAQGTQTRTFVYDSLSRLKSATNPETGTVTYVYDGNGNLTQKKDARNVTTTYTYDALDRLTLRNYSDTTPDVSYVYDASGVANSKGRLTRVSSSVSVYDYTGFDEVGRVTGSAQTTGGQTYEMGYAYDAAGNLTSRTYPSGRTVTSAYDDAGRLSQVEGQKAGEDDKTYASSFSYTAHGAVKGMKLGSLWEHTTFDTKRLQPTEIGLGTTQNGINRLKLNYSYGTTSNNGNIQTQTITVPGGPTVVQTYGYDALNRLETAHETSGATQTWEQTFTYDRYGNRRFDQTETTANLMAGNPTFNPANNKTNSGGYRHDAAGNLECSPGQICPASGPGYYEYDAENRLVENGGGVESDGSTYAYDSEGRRVKKSSATTTTVFVYDATGRLLAEYGTPTGGEGTSYLTPDNLGSTRLVTGDDGLVKSRHDYLPFGEEIMLADITGSGRTSTQGYTSGGVSQKFTGKERDPETGLDYFGARYYASTMGRFTTPDPFMPSAEVTDPQTWNRYSYVLNNPLKYVDLLGLDYSDLSEAQRRLFHTYAVKHNDGGQMTDDQVYATLDESQMATYESVTHALEHTQLTDKKTGESLGNALSLVASLDEIVGDNVGGKNHLRLYATLTSDAVSILEKSKEFGGGVLNALTPNHKRYGKDGKVITEFPDNLRQKGGVPSLQISYAGDRLQGDIDIDYRDGIGEGHTQHYNSDVRQVGPEKDNGRPINNYERYIRRWPELRQWWQQKKRSNDYYKGKSGT